MSNDRRERKREGIKGGLTRRVAEEARTGEERERQPLVVVVGRN